MTTVQKLATIERVDLREIWPREASNFTPWLAEHISELGEALGMDLEIESPEAPVGGYSLDILARDPNIGLVAIENQLEQTDHTHLGQLLTYAAGYDASTMVWIAKAFRDEHRAALDLLNARTDEDTRFFGVEVELWKIDGSRPAVNFKLVATPNEWRKQTTGNARTGNVSERGERYRAFFQALIDELREAHRFTGARKGQPTSWYEFNSGVRGISYGASFVRGGRASIGIDIDNGDGDWNKGIFDQLEENRTKIESELGGPLEWSHLDNRRACYILAVRQGSIDDDRETLEEVRQWMVERLLKFKKVFGPRLSELAN